MDYTVHDVANLAGVTIKTLYHYQKVGLLMPKAIAENGYRIYGDDELECLQQILFYRELDFSLDKIKAAMESDHSRLACLCEQKSLLLARRHRTQQIIDTLEKAIACAMKGEKMRKDTMFVGLNKKEWEGALAKQNAHLQNGYGYCIDTSDVDAGALNQRAKEAEAFIRFMAESLQSGTDVQDENVRSAIRKHIDFMRRDMDIDAQGFAAQSRFLMTDMFHRRMLEAQQVGLSYYICYAAESYAS